jgi:hypothetical protein
MEGGGEGVEPKKTTAKNPERLPIYSLSRHFYRHLEQSKKFTIGPVLPWVFSNLNPPKFYLARVHLNPEAVRVWRVH